MKYKDLKINFKYLIGNIACLTVDSISGESIHNDINNEEAIIIFNSLVGEKENCQTVKTLLEENEELKKQLKHCYCNRTDCSGRIKDSKQYDSLEQKVENQQQEFIKYLEEKIKYFKDLEQFAIKTFNNKAVINLDLVKISIDEDRIVIDNLEEILQKYEEITGVKND